MSPSVHLAAINFFIGDIQGGLGPFLSTWLTQSLQWAPAQVGLVSTIVGLATLFLNAPAGALADRSGRPRWLLCIACSAILAGTLLIPIFCSFAGILSAQFLAAAGGTLVVPAMTSLTLGIVGKTDFPRQQGRNQAFNHAGILVASALVGGATRFLGAGTAFVVLSCMAGASILAIVTTPASAWNGRRAHGWPEDEPNEPTTSMACWRSSPIDVCCCYLLRWRCSILAMGPCCRWSGKGSSSAAMTPRAGQPSTLFSRN